MKLGIGLWQSLGILGLSACASTVQRTKHSDPVARVFLDPVSIDSQNYTRLQKALVASGRWIVVDRGDAFEAARKEQDFQYKDSDERVSDRERYATYYRMYGAGGVVSGKSQCAPSARFFAGVNDYDCIQILSIIDSRTGEVLAAVEAEANDGQFLYGQMQLAPSWEKSVQALAEAFPEKFDERIKHQRIVQREDEAEKTSRALRKVASEEDVQ